MKTNWDLTAGNNKVAVHNYYSPRNCQMAQVDISTPAGILATFWCPVRYKEVLAAKALTLANELKGVVVVSHPLPDVEDAGREFDDYVFHSWE